MHVEVEHLSCRIKCNGGNVDRGSIDVLIPVLFELLPFSVDC